MNISDVIGVLSIGLGLVAGIGTAIYSTIESRRAAQTVAALSQADVATVLERPNIESLGSVLRDKLGQVRISDYVRDKAVQKEFNDLVGLVLKFLGTGDAAEVQVTQVQPDIGRGEPSRREELLPPLRDAYALIHQGQVWAGLALVRIEIERDLRNAFNLQHEGGESGRSFSAVGLIDQARSAGLLDLDDARALRYAMDVCNRGVHGFSVDIAEALQVLSIANRVLRRIRRRVGAD